eukprot:SAG11_NODE_1577_length_4652_cov_12.631013_6_plen_135_part_00
MHIMHTYICGYINSPIRRGCEPSGGCAPTARSASLCPTVARGAAQGSGAVVYTAAAPSGPYTARSNINRYGPYRESQLSFIIVPAQQTSARRPPRLRAPAPPGQPRLTPACAATRRYIAELPGGEFLCEWEAMR